MTLMVTRRLLEPGDYDAWKERFEAATSVREAAGCRGVQRFRGLENPRELVVIFDWDTIENAKAFVGMKQGENPKLKEEREDGGPKLDILFVEDIGTLSS